MQKKDFRKIHERIRKKISVGQKEIKEEIRSRLSIRHKVFFITLLIIIAILASDYFLGGITHYLFSRNIEELSTVIQSFGLIGPIIFIILVILEVMIAPIPGFILYVTGAALFGWFFGAIIVLIGNMIGATLCFYLAKYLGREYIETKISKKKIGSFDKYTDKYGVYAIFFLRVNPFTSSDLVSYAAGFSNIKYRDFFIGTLIGLIPLSFAQTYFGETLISISPFTYWIFLSLSLAYFFGMIYLIYANVRQAKKLQK